ncbi:IS630 family transposase [Chlamydiales bacterium]|nr:IS630 family transposase [Chlamydiales bacterium]
MDKKGERKEIPTNTGRQRLNLWGAINIFTKKLLIKEDDTLHAESTITFLEMIEEAYPNKSKVHLICDNARYYKNKEVTAYLATSKIKIHFLPPYSPNLNPIERLWKFRNEQVIYNKYYEKFAEFKYEVANFLRKSIYNVQTLKNTLNQRITDRFQILGSFKC